MNELGLREFKEIVEKMLEKVDCPVCFNILQAPVGQCVNGHGVCCDCRKKLSTCPLCKGVFLVTRNRVLEDILEILPHDCRFKECGEFVRPGDDHERWCGYHQSNCKYCSWKGFGKDVTSHVKTVHKTVVVHGSSNENWSFRNVNPNTTAYDVSTPVSAHGQFFWMHVTNNPQLKVFKLEFNLVPNGKVYDSFEVKLAFKNDKSTYSSTTTLTADSLKTPGREDNCIVVHSATVQSFVNANKNIPYSLFIDRIRS